MEQPIVIRFRWTADELWRASEYHFRHTCRPVFRFALHGLFALMLLAGCALMRKGDVTFALGLGLLAGGVYWFAFRRLERRWTVRRKFRQRPDRDLELEWEIGEDRIRTRCDLGHSEFGWQTFAKVVRTPAGLLLYLTDEMFHWLPRAGFANDTEFERCVALAQQKIPRYHEVK